MFRFSDRPKVYLRTYGCQMNVRDTEVIAGILKQQGYALADSSDTSDVVIFITCSVRQHAEDKVWSEIGRIAKLSNRRGKKPIIGVVGCMAQNYKETVFQKQPAVDFVVGPSDIEKIPGIVGKFIGRQNDAGENTGIFETKVWETDGDSRMDEIYHTAFYNDKDHAYIVISEGCSNFCSFCVVPYVRGKLQHRDYRSIIKEINLAVDNGITRVTLLGQNVNSYVYGDVDFVKLIAMVDKVNGIDEFSFVTSHPKDTSLELFHVMADAKKIKKYLHLPVQSGSDEILKRMNRRYSRKFYLELARNYRKIVKGGSLTSDVMVGFPGETERNFEDTYDLVKEVGFEAAFIFKYSPRPHTSALQWQDDVSKHEKERRHGLILQLQKKISLEKKGR